MIKKLEGCFLQGGKIGSDANSATELIPADALQEYLLHADPSEYPTGDSRASFQMDLNQQLAAMSTDPEKYRRLKEKLLLSNSDVGTESLFEKYPVLDQETGHQTFGGGEKPPQGSLKLDIDNMVKSGNTLLPEGGMKLSMVTGDHNLQLPEDRGSATKEAMMSSAQLMYSNMTSSHHMQAVK